MKKICPEATPEESAQIACRDLVRALRALDELPPSHDADHVRMYVRSALIWLGHKDERRPAPMKVERLTRYPDMD